MGMDVTGQDQLGPKPTAKSCYRCGVKGRIVSECAADVMCDIFLSTEHVLCQCPILREPKPVAQSLDFAVDVLGAYYIAHAPIQATKKESRMVLVTVLGSLFN